MNFVVNKPRKFVRPISPTYCAFIYELRVAISLPNKKLDVSNRFLKNIFKFPRKQPFPNKGDIYTQKRMPVEVHLPRKIHLLSVRFHVSFHVTFVVNKLRKVQFGHAFSLTYCSWQQGMLFIVPRI